jgi:D-glycero-D-manno-heptose 1,7-bisphosphate phosphatase
MNLKSAVFLDKDGVINIDQNYDVSIERLCLVKGTLEAIKMIKEKGYLVVVVTNQSGIARGFYTEDDFINQMEYIKSILAKTGVKIDGYYYCPHLEDAKVEKYKKKCLCRKPNPGMLELARKELGIEMSSSMLVGDKTSDLQAGINSGIKNVYLVRTGKKITEEGKALAVEIYDDLYTFAKELKPTT